MSLRKSRVAITSSVFFMPVVVVGVGRIQKTVAGILRRMSSRKLKIHFLSMTEEYSTSMRTSVACRDLDI